jgi:hypothetical protein
MIRPIIVSLSVWSLIAVTCGSVPVRAEATPAKPDAAASAITGSPTPAPLQTEFVYEAVVSIDPSIEVGATPLGRRRFIPITGGTFAGPRLKGVVLSGGADWQTERADGVTEADALYSVRAEDGTVIVVHNQGVIAEGGAYIRTALRFVAPEGPHAWLNCSQFVSSVAGGPRPGTVVVRVFRIL